jgi:hypothetical protein
MTVSEATRIWAANVRETRAHFTALREALYERWLTSNMEATTRDRAMARLNAHEDHYIAMERELYGMNLARVVRV